MKMITIKEYAQKRSISYEAARKSFTRYEEDLKGHYSREGRRIYIDEEAENFLNSHREGRTVVLDKDTSQLQAEVESLKKQIYEKEICWANERADLRNEIADLKLEKQKLIGDNQNLQLEDQDKLYNEKVRADNAEAELERLRAEIELKKQKKGLFARIFG